jgi:hypothetical protein
MLPDKREANERPSANVDNNPILSAAVVSRVPRGMDSSSACSEYLPSSATASWRLLEASRSATRFLTIERIRSPDF